MLQLDYLLELGQNEVNTRRGKVKVKTFYNEFMEICMIQHRVRCLTQEDFEHVKNLYFSKFTQQDWKLYDAYRLELKHFNNSREVKMDYLASKRKSKLGG